MENIRSWIPELKPAGQWFVSAILGGAVVALMDQYFAVQLEQDKRLMDLRKSAYTDFFVGQSARRLVGAGVYETKVTESRFLIGVYGSRPTVEALAILQLSFP